MNLSKKLSSPKAGYIIAKKSEINPVIIEIHPSKAPFDIAKEPITIRKRTIHNTAMLLTIP
jgi:hypothetical protein